MATFWLVVHIMASLGIGLDAHRRGRSFLLWTLATLSPFPSILITWPLLLLLPRCNVGAVKPVSPKITAFLQEVKSSRSKSQRLT